MTLYYDQEIKEYTDAGIRRYKGLDPHEELDAPTEQYGLDLHEWTGTLADKVTAIIGKNTPEKETHVNALLRDAAKSFMKNAKYAEMDAHNDETTFKKVMSVNGDDLRAAMSEASLGGILINDEAMDAIKRVEKRYLSYWSFDFGFDSLTHAYDELYKLNDARAHFRESAQVMRGAANTPAISNPESALSMSAVSTQRTGSIQAVLPGSGIKVRRAASHVPQTARRTGVVESQVQTPNVDDGFEL